MNTSSFYMQFELNIGEIRKLNKMYFKSLYSEWIIVFLVTILLLAVFCDFFYLNNDIDYIKWLVRNLILIILFFSFQYSFVSIINKVVFQLTKKLVESSRFSKKYKFNFTNSSICVYSPMGEIAHRWDQIEKAILTKDFLFLYIKERNGYIITISNKDENGRNMEQLIAFVESNVTSIKKV